MSPGSLSLAEHYHERTKYAPETLGQQNRELDWSQQPVPFKDYKIGAVIDLKPYLESRRHDDPERSFGALLRQAPKERPLLQRLSRLLLCSYGLTQEVRTLDGDRLYLRAAPSAGGLYPAELYLLSAGQPALPAGLYSYQSNTHTLVRFWSSDCWPQLQRACLWHPSLEHTQLALVSTAVFWRSVWRYQARAYRRICLDTGHVLGNVELAAALNDFRPHLIGGFVDTRLNQLLYLDESQEGAIAVAALADLLQVQQNLPLAQAALPSQPEPKYAGDPLGEDELLAALHLSSSIGEALGDRLNWKPIPVLTPPGATQPIQPPQPEPEDKYNFPFCSRFDTRTDPIDWGEGLKYLPQTILQRRSTRAYNGLDLAQVELNQLLDFTYQPEHYRLQGLPEAPDYFVLDLIETFVVVSGVEGLEAGCYYYAPKAEELRQIRFKDFRRELHYLCLGQELGRDAGAVVFHTADLHRAVGLYGDRAYRYLHLDAGHLGQRLNLAAIRLGLGVSGIAGFFDDQVNDVLGIPADEAVLYITTLGRSRSQS